VQSCPRDVAAAPLHSFRAATTLKVQFVRLSYRMPVAIDGVTDSLEEASLAEQLRSESFIKRTYPLSDLLPAPDLVLFDVGLGSRVAQTDRECALLPADLRNLCAHRYITSRLAALQAGSGPFGLLPGPPGSGVIGSADAVYALIPQALLRDGTDPYFTRGACCTSRIGAGPSDVDDYAAHELGHFLGRPHPVEGATTCGHSASDPAYPYYESFVGPGLLGPTVSLHPETDLAGFDSGDANLLLPMTHWYGQNAYDVMGYCGPHKWISDYTYTLLYGCLLTLNSGRGITPSCGPAGGAGPGGPQSGDLLTVFGNISSDGASASIIGQHVDRVFGTPPRTPGSHAIRLLGADGAVLATYAFTPEAEADSATTAGAGPSSSFGQVVPFAPGTRQIQIVEAAPGGRVIGSRAVSASAPAIGNVAVQTASNPATGVVTVDWSASDADGDPLDFDIFYTRDQGASLQPVMLGVSGQSAQIDTSKLPGGPGQFRVVATDGVNTASADSASFTLANKLPVPRILAPGAGATIFEGQLVNLEGRATDPQDGVIAESGLAWSVSGRALGAGGKVSVSDLARGVNQVMLQATNSLGLSSTGEIVITVLANVEQPGPTLTAGPSRIGWNVAVGETQLQTASLDVGNSGSGAASFTATSSAPWLTISAGSGTAPASLVVYADPAGLDAGVTAQAKVTLTSVGLPAQVLVVPVELAVGDTFTNGLVAYTVVAETGGGDAGLADGGTGAAADGGTGAAADGGVNPPVAPVPCGCGSVPSAGWFALLSLLAIRRRRSTSPMGA
jgi:hypothetical protein